MLLDNRLFLTVHLALILVVFIFCCVPTDADALDWTPPMDVHQDPAGDDRFPRLAVLPDGQVWALWLGRDPLEGDVEVYASRLVGTEWTAAEPLNAPNRISELVPRVGTASDGVIWVGWQEPDLVHPGMYTALVRRWDGSSWSAVDTLWMFGDRHDSFNISAVSRDEAWIVRDGRSVYGSTDVFVYHAHAGAIELDHQFVAPGSNEVIPTVTVDGSGTPWVAWYVMLLLDPDPIQYSRRLNGSWTVPEAIAAPKSPIAPKLVTDASGTPLLVTLADAGWLGPLKVEVWALRWDGSQWEPPVRLNAEQDRDDLISQLSVSDEPGVDPVAIWVRQDALSVTRADLVYSRWTSEGWTPPALAGALADSALVESPDVARVGDTIWAAYNRGLGKPYLQHVFVMHSAPNTFLDTAQFTVRPAGVGALLSWSSKGDRELLALQVRRSGPGDLSASVIADLRGQRSRGGSYADRSVVAPGQYSYWMDFIFADPETLSMGPQTITIWDSASILDGAVVENRVGSIALRGAAAGPAGKHHLQIFDVRGRLVRTIPFDVTASGYRVSWDGRTAQGAAAATGVYFLRLPGDPGSGGTRKVVLTR